MLNPKLELEIISDILNIFSSFFINKYGAQNETYIED